MTVESVEAEVESLRATASRAQQYYIDLAEQINADTTLSDTGKSEKRREAFAQQKEKLQGLLAREKQLIDDEIATLRVRIESRSGTGSSDIIAFRDAQDRADRLASADEALPMIDRAIRQRDTSLASAVFRRAMDAGWQSVVDRYLAAHPQAADVIRDLNYMTRARDNSFQRTLAYALFEG
ncbi:hypothetical protein JVX92_00615 [Microbacterium hominis]|uniref:hypothetical protein n=1 Tax=Microbacterium hominis TaxID=162426 RepID=UPI0019626E1C|nr:hypothetical protein [Microbacterium hominis]QRY40831.1 hypothetical protein JVX92_00615 [Microbacterium hominis]